MMCFNQIRHVCEECLSQMQLQNLECVVCCSRIESQSSSRCEPPLARTTKPYMPKESIKMSVGLSVLQTGTKQLNVSAEEPLAQSDL